MHDIRDLTIFAHTDSSMVHGTAALVGVEDMGCILLLASGVIRLAGTLVLQPPAAVHHPESIIVDRQAEVPVHVHVFVESLLPILLPKIRGAFHIELLE